MPAGPAPLPLWFPNFCRPGVVFGLMVLGELVVVIMALAPGRTLDDPFRHLALASLFVQWVALMCATALCGLRRWLNRAGIRTGLTLAYLVVLAITAAASFSAVWVDRFAGLNLTLPGPSIERVVGNNLLVAALVAAAALRYYYVQQQWRADLQVRAQARIKALQARIRPHFLFNSMNTIASLIRTHPEVAERTVEDLSELFRSALSEAETDSTLGQELQLCRRYLAIEQLRLGDRLELSWPADGLPEREPLPPLILQPLFENAVYHGIQPLPAGGRIDVTSGCDDDCWWIRIANPVAAGGTEPGHQMALRNIRERLEHRFAGRAKLAVEQDDAGFAVTVTVPLRARTPEA